MPLLWWSSSPTTRRTPWPKWSSWPPLLRWPRMVLATASSTGGASGARCRQHPPRHVEPRGVGALLRPLKAGGGRRPTLAGARGPDRGRRGRYGRRAARLRRRRRQRRSAPVWTAHGAAPPGAKRRRRRSTKEQAAAVTGKRRLD
ncbi:hypothetical protein PVAP13_3NG140809 [Panicum virgatum]|uniref:Uncharacterized protein n=1 Tax=Panicum virgatum TaxID=38727 RepID=A0A8T0U3G9_PANVG|nr:hypothetical protein PVAP13_3NG140809 [Panicum virgatum]